MGKGSHRQRMFAVRREVHARIGGPVDRFALSWLTDDRVIARLRVGRGFRYGAFAIPVDDEALITEMVAWVHAVNPSTS